MESDLVCHELTVLSGWASSFDLSGHGNVNLPLKEARITGLEMPFDQMGRDADTGCVSCDERAPRKT